MATMNTDYARCPACKGVDQSCPICDGLGWVSTAANSKLAHEFEFLLAQFAFLKEGLTDPDVLWEMRVRYALKEVEDRGLKVAP